MKVIQTKKAKEEFYSPIYTFLKTTKTRHDIANYLGMSPRKAREEVHLLSKHYAVIRGSFQKGYRLARPIDTMDHNEKLKEQQLILRTINEFTSRIQDMKQTLKPLIAYLKVLEKKIAQEEKK